MSRPSLPTKKKILDWIDDSKRKTTKNGYRNRLSSMESNLNNLSGYRDNDTIPWDTIDTNDYIDIKWHRSEGQSLFEFINKGKPNPKKMYHDWAMDRYDGFRQKIGKITKRFGSAKGKAKKKKMANSDIVGNKRKKNINNIKDQNPKKTLQLFLGLPDEPHEGTMELAYLLGIVKKTEESLSEKKNEIEPPRKRRRRK